MNYEINLQIIEIINPAAPEIIGSHDTPSYAWDVAVDGGYTFVEDGESGLQIIRYTRR